MCGIAGILRQGAIDGLPGEIARMTGALAHRGPDGQGALVRGNLALGHRRLAIIDLEAGRQPMGNEDGQVQIVFNGEIYNFKTLRAELETLGHVFASHSDTEVIVHAYEQWGVDCVRKLRGMFAFAVADFKNRRLFLARDHLGIKPLVYRAGPGYFAFASELQALRQVDAPVPAGSLRAMDLYLRFRYVPDPDTIYQDVKKLPPGHRMLLDFEGNILEGPTRYWAWRYQVDESLSEGQWLERFDAACERVVRSQLVSDVPFGVFLSGGVDSTLVAAWMSKILDRKVVAFSIGFEDESQSELPHARQAAERLGVDLRCEVVSPDVVDIAQKLVRHYGEPFGDSSSIPTWCVSRLARGHVPMVLSGDGGDELFCGYTRYREWMRRRPVLDPLLEIRNSPLHAFFLVRTALSNWLSPQDVMRRGWQETMSTYREGARQRLWRAEYRAFADMPSEAFDAACAAADRACPDSAAYAQFVDIATYLPGDILAKVDAASMAHGLEVRPPLLDVELLELAATLPFKMRYAQGANTGSEPILKPLPKAALASQFPQEFVHRRKQGFTVSEDFWLGQGKPMRRLFDDLVLSPNAPIAQWLDPAAIRQDVATLDRSGAGATRVWTLLQLALWLDQNRDVAFS